MKNYCLIFSYFFFTYLSNAQDIGTKLISKEGTFILHVNQKNFMIHGMNWDYFPVGTNYDFILWKQSDAFIKKALESEMTLLQKMHVNAIRVYTGIPKRWIEYIYEQYGIYTMLNHSFGRYGMNIQGKWVSNTNYADADTRKTLIEETTQLAKEYQNTKGLLLFLLGNENNYGLFWQGAETEDIPQENKNNISQAKALYQLFDEAIVAMKKIHHQYPIAICNGDLQFLDIIAKECTNMDILGINVYRGESFGDLFERVRDALRKPIIITELGADAYHDVLQKEDAYNQAHYLKENWREIYENAANMGKCGNSLGGFTFQFSDGWWKYGQTFNLDQHDNNASWVNGGYKHDFVKGKNNMNEEWFGICAKEKTKSDGHYDLKPRASYYVLQKIHEWNVYEKSNAKKMKRFFDKIKISAFVKQ